MVNDAILEKYLRALLEGDRQISRTVIEEALQSGIPANNVYMEIIWPIMIEIENLYKQGNINFTQEHIATRINRTIVDQLQNTLPRKPKNEKKIAIGCADSESSELGAQIAADLFESSGWEVRFFGGGVSNDDILEFIHGYSPDVLLIYGATSQNAPVIRQLIDTVREINACPDMKIMLSGGLFNRAEGLWEEIGADLFASTAAEAVEIASDENQTACQPERTINRRKLKSAGQANKIPVAVQTADESLNAPNTT